MVTDDNGHVHGPDGRFARTGESGPAGVHDLPMASWEPNRADSVRMGGVAKAEALASMGDEDGARRVADALGAMRPSDLADWYGPEGSHAAVWNGRTMYSVTLNQFGEITLDDSFDLRALPVPTRDAERLIASVPVSAGRN